MRPDLPVILCTGFNERMNEEKALALGVKAFILKPLVMRELAIIIRKVLDGKE
jgi:CheY-like chemotaxis protein